MLEPYDGKLSRTVLRGKWSGDTPDLPDNFNKHWSNFNMNMNRKLVKKINMSEEVDDGHVQAEKNELISMIWEITKDNWAFVRGQDV